jgi:tetratricopeptide (TPR) repeat protein
MDFPDAVYHVTTRGNGRADIFFSDDDRQRFLAQLSHHLQQTGIVLHAYTLMDNHFHGLADFAEAIRLDPRNGEAHFYRGCAYGEHGDFVEAISDFTEVVRLDPKLAKAYYYRGIAFKEKGERKRASADLAEARRLEHEGTV